MAMRGISSVLTFTVLVLIAVMAIAIALAAGRTVFQSAASTIDVKDAESVLSLMSDRLWEVASEGNGSARAMPIYITGSFVVSQKENTIEFQARDVKGFDYLSRVQRGDIMYIAGNDVTCTAGAALVMENSYLRAEFQNVSGAVDTGKNILKLTEKQTGRVINIVNSSVVIDNDLATQRGTGYSELLTTGRDLPVGTVHVFVHSSVDYDVFYRLYAGADFLTAEVRIR
jgi:hypothetical protein